MVKIHIHEDCGNAPKKLFVKDFIIAIVANDQDFVARNTTDDLHWNIVGGVPTDGKQRVLAALRQARGEKVVELTINTIITHGYNGMAEGTLKFKNGKVVAFCDIYLFRASTNNAPVKVITTYAIPME